MHDHDDPALAPAREDDLGLLGHTEWGLEVAVVGVLTVLGVGAAVRMCWPSLLVVAGAVALCGGLVGAALPALFARAGEAGLGRGRRSSFLVSSVGLASLVLGAALLAAGLGAGVSFAWQAITEAWGAMGELFAVATTVQVVWVALPLFAAARSPELVEEE